MKVGDKVKVTYRVWGDHIGATGIVDSVQNDGLVSVLLDGFPFRYYATFGMSELQLLNEGDAPNGLH
jgi:hypothetical protein